MQIINIVCLLFLHGFQCDGTTAVNAERLVTIEKHVVAKELAEQEKTNISAMDAPNDKNVVSEVPVDNSVALDNQNLAALEKHASSDLNPEDESAKELAAPEKTDISAMEAPADQSALSEADATKLDKEKKTLLSENDSAEKLPVDNSVAVDNEGLVAIEKHAASDPISVNEAAKAVHAPEETNISAMDAPNDRNSLTEEDATTNTKEESGTLVSENDSTVNSPVNSVNLTKTVPKDTTVKTDTITL